MLRHRSPEHQEPPLNIRTLNLETPREREDFRFDPERDITESQIEKIKGDVLLLSARSSGYDLGQILGDLSRLKLLFPGRAPEFGINNELWETIQHKKPLGTTNPTNRLCNAAAIRILFPEHFNELQFNNIKEELRSTSVLLRGWDAINRTIISGRAISGEKQQKLGQELITELNTWRARKSPGHCLQIAAFLRLIAPKEFSARIVCDTSLLAWMRRSFLEKGETPEKFFPTPELIIEAWFLQIIDAENIEFTKQDGLKLTMPTRKEELKPATPPIPERKKFD